MFVNGHLPRRRGLVVLVGVVGGFLLTTVSAEFVDQTIGDNVANTVLGHNAEQTPIAGASGGFALSAGAALPPLLLEDDEAVAITGGLRMTAGQPIAGLDEASVRALAKLVQVLPTRLRGRVSALTAATSTLPSASEAVADPEALTLLAAAIQRGSRVRFSYQGKARHAEPHHLVATGRRWYLVAFDNDRNDWRTFRMDRIQDPSAETTTFRKRTLPAEDPAAFVRASFTAAPSRYRVIADVHAPLSKVESIAQFWGSAEPRSKNRCRLTINTDSLEMCSFTLASLDVPFRVISPDVVRTYLHTLGTRFAAA
jgi:predicted DNA-binding transcriptional regulator YafY